MEQGAIYCVDDDMDILVLYQVILSGAGHEVTKISSGDKALEVIYQKQPDLIILDERMNDLSGMEICARIRSDKSLGYIPIIMVTGVDSREGKIRSLEEGIDDYILKPFDHEELLAKVQVMLRIKRLYGELLQIRQDLLKAEKLAAIGQLAAAMAHEIRNPLSIIGASVQFLQSKLEPNDERREVMDIILRKISEIDSTIRELLAVARPLKLKHEPVDVNESVQELVGFIKEKCLVQKVGLDLVLSQGLAHMYGDKEHLQRALLNIFINAINSMPQGGTLTVTTAAKPGNEGVSIGIADTGEGISPDDLPHVFEPFFSRRPGGSGLGLFVVKTIVDELKGTIEVESIPKQGTRFTLLFPLPKSEKGLKPMEVVPETKRTGERSDE